MPNVAPRPCRRPGCPALVAARDGLCELHQGDIDSHRGSARSRGYTAEWDKAARGFKRAHPLCLGCQAVGRYTATFLVDHVEPHRGNRAKFWDQAMWQPACEWHGNAVKQQLERLYDEGKITLAELWLNSEAAKRLTLTMGR